MKKSMLLFGLFLTSVAMAQGGVKGSRDADSLGTMEGTSGSGIDITTLVIGLVVGLAIGYFIGLKMNKK